MLVQTSFFFSFLRCGEATPLNCANLTNQVQFTLWPLFSYLSDPARRSLRACVFDRVLLPRAWNRLSSIGFWGLYICVHFADPSHWTTTRSYLNGLLNGLPKWNLPTSNKKDYLSFAERELRTTPRKIWRGCEAHFPKSLPYIRPKSTIFPTLK